MERLVLCELSFSIPQRNATVRHLINIGLKRHHTGKHTLQLLRYDQQRVLHSCEGGFETSCSRHLCCTSILMYELSTSHVSSVSLDYTIPFLCNSHTTIICILSNGQSMLSTHIIVSLFALIEYFMILTSIFVIFHFR